jgi:hypothetical protein
MYKKTLILATLFLLLTSCDKGYWEDRQKIEETKINNTKIVEDSEPSSE